MLYPFSDEEHHIDSTLFNNNKIITPIVLQNKQERSKLWELDHNYHCAVIGTCLTLDEVKKLLRSFKMPVDGISSYDIHTAIVTLISYNDFRSRKIQNYLNKKFKLAIQKSKKMNATELIQEWKRVVNKGELIATFWAVIAHPCSTKQMKRDFYGDIHMQSHMSGASNRVDLRRLTQLEKDQKKINQENLIQQATYQKLQAENTRLHLTIQQKTEENIGLSNHITALANANEHLTLLKGTTEIDQLNSQLIRLEHKTKFQTNEINIYKKNQVQQNEVVTALKQQSSRDKQTITEYKNEIDYLQYTLSRNKSDDQCLLKKQGLCGQCVLYVGGKANLIPHYRELVEENLGIFIYHDGGMEKSTQDLSQLLNRADLVIFPSSCISHKAYWKIKNTCKKQQKPYEHLKSAGLHSLSNTLDKFVTESKVMSPVAQTY